MPTISQREAGAAYSPEEILQKASALIIVADSRGAITYVSPSVKTILGYEPSDMLGDTRTTVYGYELCPAPGAAVQGQTWV